MGPGKDKEICLGGGVSLRGWTSRLQNLVLFPVSSLHCVRIKYCQGEDGGREAGTLLPVTPRRRCHLSLVWHIRGSMMEMGFVEGNL